MSSSPSVNLYSLGTGTASSAQFPSSPIRQNKPPTSTDIQGAFGLYPIGQVWIDESAPANYMLSAFSSSNGSVTATWNLLSAGSGDLDELSSDSGTATPTGGAITIAGGAGVTTSATGSTVTIALTGGSTAIDSFVPDAGTNPVVPSSTGSVTMAGTANQITTTGGLNSLTMSLPSAITTPGSLTTTTSLTASNGFNVLAGTSNITGPVNINTTGADTTSIGAGGTGAVTIGNITGNTGVTGDLNVSNSIDATGTISAGFGVVTSSGNLTASNGNLTLNSAGNKLQIATGSNASTGTTAAMVAGVIVVVTTACNTTSQVLYSRKVTGGTTGDVSITAQDTTGFTLTSTSNTETSTFNWLIIN